MFIPLLQAAQFPHKATAKQPPMSRLSMPKFARSYTNWAHFFHGAGKIVLSCPDRTNAFALDTYPEIASFALRCVVVA